MIIVSERIIELNAYDVAAATALGFPFHKFTCKRVGPNGSHLRVSFHSAAECDKWKRAIFAHA